MEYNMGFFEHGGQVMSEISNYDFSVNINPLGLSEEVREAILASGNGAVRYPNNTCRELRKMIAATWYEGANPHEIVCTAGASEAIFAIVRATRPTSGMILAPTFSEYERALLAADVPIEIYTLDREKGYELTEAFLDTLDRQPQGSLLFLCNPNNPIGNCIKDSVMNEVLNLAQQKNIWVIVDECFLPFLPAYEERSLKHVYQKYDRLCILNAFTKFYAMPGLRLGFVVSANMRLCQSLCLQLPTWNVSSIAQEAGIAALQSTDYAERTRQCIAKEQDYLVKGLLNCKGIRKVYPPMANFVFIEAEESLASELLQYQIIIRRCENYRTLGKGCYRIAVRTHEENEYLVHSLEKCFNGIH